MLKVRISSVSPGMVLGKSIYNSSGNVLLTAGMVLDNRYIKRLKEMGIPAVYIKDSRFREVDLPREVVLENTRIQTQVEVRNVFQQIEHNGKINLGSAKRMINKILDEILANRGVLISLSDIRAYDDEVFGHSVSVAILSIMTGLKLGYNQLQLRELGVGSLLHDLGKACIAKTILNKKQRLTAQEFDGIKEHSRLGFEILREQEEISLLAAHIAVQHHEKYNGSGYPRGLKGAEIHEFARITAVADVYDAMTSDRIYRPAFTPMETVQVLLESMGSHLDPDLVKIFIKNIALYPVGSIVTLNTGEVGVVVITHPHFSDRPVVRLILDKHQKQFNRFYEINLATNTEYSIVSVLNDYNETLPPITHVGGRIIGPQM